MRIGDMIVQATVQLAISISKVDVFAQISNVTIGGTLNGAQFAAGASGAISGALTVAMAIGGCIEGYRDIMQASVTEVVDKVMGRGARSHLASSSANINTADQAPESLDNVVYVLVTEQGKKSLANQGTSGQKIADQINQNMDLKKLTTRAVYWEGDPRNFDVNKMGKKSSLAVIGEGSKDVADFYYKEIDRWFSDMYLNNPKDYWNGGSSNPERSQNFKHTTIAGQAKFIAVDGSALKWFGESMSAGEHKISATQSGAFLVMHGMGHNADLNCRSSGRNENYSEIMEGPINLKETIRSNGYRGIFIPELVNGKDLYVEAIKNRYYDKN